MSFCIIRLLPLLFRPQKNDHLLSGNTHTHLCHAGHIFTLSSFFPLSLLSLSFYLSLFHSLSIYLFLFLFLSLFLYLFLSLALTHNHSLIFLLLYVSPPLSRSFVIFLSFSLSFSQLLQLTLQKVQTIRANFLVLTAKNTSLKELRACRNAAEKFGRFV